MGRQSCIRWSWALWPREPTKKCQLYCQQDQQHQEKTTNRSSPTTTTLPPPSWPREPSWNLRTGWWLCQSNIGTRESATSPTSLWYQVHFIFYSSFLMGLKWPWMIWSHFDNAETLNSNTSVLVLLRLDTSPIRVALLTAPNSPCCLFV